RRAETTYVPPVRFQVAPESTPRSSCGFARSGSASSGRRASRRLAAPPPEQGLVPVLEVSDAARLSCRVKIGDFASARSTCPRGIVHLPRGRWRLLAFEDFNTALELRVFVLQALQLRTHPCGVFLLRRGGPQRVDGRLQFLAPALVRLARRHPLQRVDRLFLAAVAQGLQRGGADAAH